MSSFQSLSSSRNWSKYGQRQRIRFAVAVRHDGSVCVYSMRTSFRRLSPTFTRDLLVPHFERTPFAAELVLSVLQFLFVNVGGVRTAGRHGDGRHSGCAPTPETEGPRSRHRRTSGRRRRCAFRRNGTGPYQVRCGSITAMGGMHGGTRWRQQHFVRAVIRHGIGLDADVHQLLGGFALRPAPDDVTPQRHQSARARASAPMPALDPDAPAYIAARRPETPR